MPNEYYTPTGTPGSSSFGNSSLIRAEFDKIEDGFDKMPTLAGHGNEAVFVNAGGTALEPVSAATARSRLSAEDSSKKDASDGYAGLTLMKINFMNVLGTIKSFFTNSNTISRTYTFPDQSGTVALTSDLPPIGKGNKIINGDFDVWQRGTSHSASGYGSDDRWMLNANGSTFVNSQQTFTLGQTDVPDNPTYYCRAVVTSVANAANYCRKEQRIEFVKTLSGLNARLSFYAKADAARNIAIELAQHFGTGGAPSADVTAIGSQKVSLTTSWAKYEVTIAVPSISGKTLGSDANDYLALIFWMDAGSDFNLRTDTLGQQSGTFEFSHIQLEEGSATSEFEIRAIGEELELCRRFYQEYQESAILYSGNVTSGQTYTARMDLMTVMRAAPSATLTGVLAVSFPTASGTVYADQYIINETRTASATARGIFASSVIAEAEL
jgi:hypothetical protein